MLWEDRQIGFGRLQGELRCGHRDIPGISEWSSVRSGTRSPEVIFPRNVLWRWVSHRSRGRDGSVMLAGCRRIRGALRRAGSCRSPSGKRSRCCGPRARVSGKSLQCWVVALRRFRGNCGVMPRPGVASSITGRRLPSGKRSCSPGARRQPSWRRTSACATMSSSAWPGRSQALTGSLWPALEPAPGLDGTSRTAVIVAGCRRGARSRSPNAWRSTTLTTRRCVSAMKRSTRRYISKVAARSSGS